MLAAVVAWPRRMACFEGVITVQIEDCHASMASLFSMVASRCGALPLACSFAQVMAALLLWRCTVCIVRIRLSQRSSDAWHALALTVHCLSLLVVLGIRLPWRFSFVLCSLSGYVLSFSRSPSDSACATLTWAACSHPCLHRLDAVLDFVQPRMPSRTYRPLGAVWSCSKEAPALAPLSYAARYPVLHYAPRGSRPCVVSPWHFPLRHLSHAA
ncbi:hypothetical protein V6N12_016209 [Hibiscus sabdariffa]|uniref:Uncharacterized protein n=1 Tax=Hibiscus sabdariffa TaxID=183260 RepID=A0ABR2C906_9ROSI